MQAHKLKLAEAHPSQVVKVEVDAASQSAALLLRDSSCLLFPTLSESAHPLLIPPFCTDICFLRLRQRCSTGTQITSSSASDKSAETISRSDRRNLANVSSKPSMATPESIGDTLSKVASVGDAAAGSANETLLFLALKPSKGGVCSDLVAWRYSVSQFFRTSIFLEGSSDCATFARLQGIPHGISARIAASVNVVVVHSPAVGKLWVFSAKFSKAEHNSIKCDRTEPRHIFTKDSVCNNVVHENTRVLDNGNHEKNLHLFKCAVVDCDGPIYSMHLSLQHLLVGQVGGVRLWLLRPLIKGCAVARKDLKAAYHNGRCTASKHDRNKSSEVHECGKKTVEIFQSSNGIHAAAKDVAVQTRKGFCPVMSTSKNGFYESSLRQCDGVKLTHMNGFNSMEEDIFSKKQGCVCSRKGSEYVCYCTNGFLKQDSNSEVHQDAPKLVQLEGAIIPSHRSGGTFEYEPEELKSQQRLSQFSMFSSSSDSSSSLPLPNMTCERSSSCQSLCSSLSSVVGASRKNGSYNKTENGTIAGVFVTLYRNQTPLSIATSLEQVTSIHGLSEKDFIVLDSSGKLHLLTLQYLACGNVAKSYKAQRVSLNASLQPLTCGIKIKFITVLPDLRTDKRNSDIASRILWISDGGHTVYVMMVCAGEFSKEGSGKAQIMSKSSLTVTGTLFLTERALLLSALNENAVMVLTEGSIIAYSSTGA